jgi:hypothetical protein
MTYEGWGHCGYDPPDIITGTESTIYMTQPDHRACVVRVLGPRSFHDLGGITIPYDPVSPL